MPIRPENRDRYPANWKELRLQILKRARGCCEWCAVVNGSRVERDGNGAWRTGPGDDWSIPGRLPERWRLDMPREYQPTEPRRLVRIVLTIAHLDHVPEHCEPENLRALCQLCHNRYDAPHRARGRKARGGGLPGAP